MQTLQRLFIIVLSLSFTVAGQTVLAQTSAAASALSDSEFQNLTEKEQRKLSFYANKVAEELVKVSALQQTGKVDEANAKLANAHKYAERLKATANEANIGQDQVAELVLKQLASAYSGPIPKSLIDERGLLNVTDFIYGDHRGSLDNTSNDGDYVDLLKAEEAGGVKN